MAHLDNQDLAGIGGLHFHVMCEQGANVLARQALTLSLLGLLIASLLSLLDEFDK